MSTNEGQDQRDIARAPSPWSSLHHQNGTASPPTSTDPTSRSFNSNGPYSAPPTSPSRLPDRQNIPTRASTLGSSDPSRHLAPKHSNTIPFAHSEDLNHSTSFGAGLPGSSPKPAPAFLSPGNNSRPSTPAGSSQHKPTSSSGHSDDSNHRTSIASFSSAQSGSSTSSDRKPPPTATSSTSASVVPSYVPLMLHPFFPNIFLFLRNCSACGKAMQGPFVRALGTVFHLNCFKCMVRVFCPGSSFVLTNTFLE